MGVAVGVIVGDSDTTRPPSLDETTSSNEDTTIVEGGELQRKRPHDLEEEGTNAKRRRLDVSSKVDSHSPHSAESSPSQLRRHSLPKARHFQLHSNDNRGNDLIDSAVIAVPVSHWSERSEAGTPDLSSPPKDDGDAPVQNDANPQEDSFSSPSNKTSAATIALDDVQSDGIAEVNSKSDSPVLNETATEQDCPCAADQDENVVRNLPGLGARVEIYWDGEQQYFSGTVVKGRSDGLLFVKYDDGDEEWVDFHKERYRILDECRIDSLKHSESSTALPSKTEAKDWVAAAGIPRCDSDSDTDNEELLQWAVKMLGVPHPPPIARRKAHPPVEQSSWQFGCDEYDVPMSISEKVKLARRNRSTAVSFAPLASPPRKQSVSLSKSPTKKVKAYMADPQCDMEAKLKKEQARPLTAAEIKSILGNDMEADTASSSWVRRSVRQPSKSHLTAPRVKQLLEKLLANDSDMVVLKMKKYCSDLDTPTIVIDAVLDALEENTNCEALYIQNFNEGMRDEQVLHLLRILQRPSCKIWCLNIGETYKVQMKTWVKFTKGLADTNITHMYASEHTITAELKEQIRETIRLNRKKHHWHDDPANIDTIVQCTHCWWNPINAKSLRPYLQRKGYDHILRDAETQGLPGTMSGAFLS